MKRILLALLISLFMLTPVYAAQCGPAIEAIEMVTGPKYEEKLHEKTAQGVYVYGNCSTGTFTMFIDAPDRVKPPEHKGEPGLCLISAGRGFKDSPYCNKESI